MRKRYSEEQIIGALKRQEAGTTVSDLCSGQAILSSGQAILDTKLS